MDRQAGQKQYAPDHLIRGHKDIDFIFGVHTLLKTISDDAKVKL